MAAICRARLLSDLSGQTLCDKEATSVDGRLCAFHSRQCQGMWAFVEVACARMMLDAEQVCTFYNA